MRRVVQDAVEVGGDSRDVLDQRPEPLLEPGPDRPFGLRGAHLGLVILDGHSGVSRAPLGPDPRAQVYSSAVPRTRLIAVSVPRSGGNSGWTSGVEIPVT